MTRCWIAALVTALFAVACGDTSSVGERPGANNTAASGEGSREQAANVAFTEADLDGLERGLRKEIEAVKAAQAKASGATTAAERGEAMQAQWETATIPIGAEGSGLPEARYRDVRESVDRVFTTLDFQDKIDGPLSLDLERADPDTKARVSRDAFTDLPAGAATALRTRMDRLVPVWSEYKTLVAVAG